MLSPLYYSDGSAMTKLLTNRKSRIMTARQDSFFIISVGKLTLFDYRATFIYLTHFETDYCDSDISLYLSLYGGKLFKLYLLCQ